MQNYGFVLLILAVMIGLSALAQKARVPMPVLLITAGIVLGFIPSVPKVELDPDVIFLIFLPPLLFDAAFNIPAAEFRENLPTISTLAITLVFITTAGIAVAAKFLIPGMTWPLAFVLGAILSATDAVAALSITKGLGLPHKTTTILEGESLVNDASSLVAYNFAVGAVTGLAFVWWKAGIQFAILMAGGFLVGFVSGKVLSIILTRLKENYAVSVSFVFLAPFVTYLLAEALHVSGIIAVVVLGIGIGQFSNKVLPPHLKNQAKAFWEIIIFLLNGLIFILIGLEFPFVMAHIDHKRILPYLGYALVITVVALALRMSRIFLQQAGLQRAFQSTRRRRKPSEAALLDTRTSLIIGWSGMRGIVSLAIAIGLPYTFPERGMIIFISVAVVLFTIFGQGLTLPWLIRKLEKRLPI
ncbi:Na+/H+ antiporter [Dinghuibacter silviterrae]|uniref:CPA1 family monovalent cation:H+ antiporter n=1 Tax=Dinghuibacter silviterrae TaxID=1539049 RepID=A0A4R8DH11_9BACT|nr:Na+/H+ antiporter [Dinghuibacter silviterrae]TDW96396.1 CPA1 family monovalent cation:H+ antiporter [Dinghuibacter silviterrae]